MLYLVHSGKIPNDLINFYFESCFSLWTTLVCCLQARLPKKHWHTVSERSPALGITIITYQNFPNFAQVRLKVSSAEMGYYLLFIKDWFPYVDPSKDTNCSDQQELSFWDITKLSENHLMHSAYLTITKQQTQQKGQI